MYLGIVYRFFIPRAKRPISGEIALVTGAGSGTGRAVCLELAKKGACVVCVDIEVGRAEQTVDAIREKGGVAFW